MRFVARDAVTEENRGPVIYVVGRHVIFNGVSRACLLVGAWMLYSFELLADIRARYCYQPAVHELGFHYIG